MNDEKYPLAMAEEVWANSPLSIVRRTGRLKLGGYEYVICNKEGKDIFQCSIEAEKAGREKAIEAGEPADLVRRDVVPIYRKLGRKRFIQFCNDNPDMWTAKEVNACFEKWNENDSLRR